MNPLRHLFVMDPLEDLNLTLDTSLRLAAALAKRGHDILMTECTQLTLAPGGDPICQAWPLTFGKGEVDRLVKGSAQPLRLATCSAIYMRKDPPTNQAYWQATWILDRVPKPTKVLNSPKALRDINEKLSIFMFPDYAAPAIVTSDPTQAIAFANGLGGLDLIIKPLDLFGGRGVSRLDLRQMSLSEAESKISQAFNGDGMARILQPFDDSIFEGELRVFSAGGEAITWCLKRPAPGSYLANTGQGATLHDYQPSARELRMVSAVSRDLLDRGVYFVGFDIIGDHISEINITSPRLLAKDLSPIHFDLIAEGLTAYLSHA
jgi:glutathione synthase